MIRVTRLALALVLVLTGMAAVSSFQQTPAPAPVSLSVADLRAEYAANPVGIDVRQPRLSWQLRSPARGVTQSAYQVQVASSDRALRSGKPLTWDSGVVKSGDSVNVAYAGPAMQSGQRFTHNGLKVEGFRWKIQ